VDPFFIVPEKCRCIDYQLLKLQEAPEAVPNGELPRHVQLYCDRYLCDRVVPGNRVTVVGIYSIKKSFATTRVSFLLAFLFCLLYFCFYCSVVLETDVIMLSL